jgi:hypothetical protein
VIFKGISPTSQRSLIRYPPRKGMKSNTRIESRMTLNLLTAVWEYSSVFVAVYVI